MFSQESPHPLLVKESPLSAEEREDLLANYVTRGRALRLEGDRGLIDSHRRRALNLGQFFTPARVVQLMYQAIGLLDHPAWTKGKNPWEVPKTGSIVDFAGCGNGRLFQFAPTGWSLHGADIDPLACRAASLCFPEAEIMECSLLDFQGHGKVFSAALLNPPFSVNLTSRTAIDMASAQWGIWGRGTSIESHLAAVELASKMAELVAVILPTSCLDGAQAITFKKASGSSYGWGCQLRIDLPKDAFSDEGTEWPCSLLVLGDLGTSKQVSECGTWTEVESAMASWIESQALAPYWSKTVLKAVAKGDRASTLGGWVQRKQEPARAQETAPLKGAGSPMVRLALGGRAHKIQILPNNMSAALSIQEAKLWEGWITSDGFDPQSKLDWLCDLVRNAGKAEACIDQVKACIEEKAGVTVVVDEQLKRHARRADLRASVELTPFRQWIRRGDGWEERGRIGDPTTHPALDLIRGRSRHFHRQASAIPNGLVLKAWDRSAKAHVQRSWKAFPVYSFALQDVVRSLSKRSVIYSAKQGLGKTRYSIAAVLASGMSKALWVLESRLVNEFKRELSKLGLLEEFHLIETKADLQSLKTFNCVTYSRLWRPVNEGSEKRSRRWGPGKSFAAALAKRRMFVVIDEAHKIRSANSKQGIAARLLCMKARRVIEMTGTAVSSYPRNVLGLVTAGWGDGSSMAPYGYRRPVEGGYQVSNGRSNRWRGALVKGVTKFIDENVQVLWYTPCFEQTASTGMKSREIPALKDVPLWESFIRSKLIRRVPGEPEVRASGLRTPEAHPLFVGVQPTIAHFAHYKLVLDHFAKIWEERLKAERETGTSTSSVAAILPELDALRFASTVPVTKHRWADGDPILRYGSKEPTALMRAALEKIASWVEAGDRVVVGAEKPDALRWLADLLADLPSYVEDAEPIMPVLALDADIAKRNAAIDQARDDQSSPVLLISVGMGKEGLNLGAFSKLLTLDLGWVPADLDQFAHRILRPDQVGDPEIVHLYHEGLIDSYMKQLCEAKTDAIAQAIDGQQTTFDYSNWLDYRSFALQMLEREGYAFAAKALADERCALAC